VGDNTLATGAGLGWQGQVGARMHAIELGGELSHHHLGGSRRVLVYGGFARIPAGELDRFHPYIVLALEAYRFSPVPHGTGSHLGGSGGPGARFVMGARSAILLEARFHTTFSKVPSISTQDFLSVLAGLDLSL